MKRKRWIFPIIAVLIIPILAYFYLHQETNAGNGAFTNMVTFITSLVLTGYYATQS